jgi:hypothetical protein
MTLVVAGILATHTLPSGAVNLPSLVAIIVLAGALQMALGLFRIGAYIRYVPYPVISGFMTGIGVIIILQQLFPMLGAEPAVFGAVVDPPPVASAGRQHQMGRRCLIHLDHRNGLHTAAIHESGSSLARCPGGADGAGGVAGA